MFPKMIYNILKWNFNQEFKLNSNCIAISSCNCTIVKLFCFFFFFCFQCTQFQVKFPSNYTLILYYFLFWESILYKLYLYTNHASKLTGKKLNSNLLYSYVILIILWMSTIYYLIDKKFHTHMNIYVYTYIYVCM